MICLGDAPSARPPLFFCRCFRTSLLRVRYEMSALNNTRPLPPPDPIGGYRFTGLYPARQHRRFAILLIFLPPRAGTLRSLRYRFRPADRKNTGLKMIWTFSNSFPAGMPTAPIPRCPRRYAPGCPCRCEPRPPVPPRSIGRRRTCTFVSISDRSS